MFSGIPGESWTVTAILSRFLCVESDNAGPSHWRMNSSRATGADLGR